MTFCAWVWDDDEVDGRVEYFEWPKDADRVVEGVYLGDKRRDVGYHEEAYLALNHDGDGLRARVLVTTPIAAAGEWEDITHMLGNDDRERCMDWLMFGRRP